MPNEQDHDILIRLDENVKAIMACIPPMEVKVNILEVCNGSIVERLKSDEQEIEKLRSQSVLHNWINSVGVVITGAIAAWFGNKP